MTTGEAITITRQIDDSLIVQYLQYPSALKVKPLESLLWYLAYKTSDTNTRHPRDDVLNIYIQPRYNTL